MGLRVHDNFSYPNKVGTYSQEVKKFSNIHSLFRYSIFQMMHFRKFEDINVFLAYFHHPSTESTFTYQVFTQIGLLYSKIEGY